VPLPSQDQQKAIVAAHNAYRSQDPAVNARDVTWDPNLAADAQKWADNLATNVHTLQHSSNPKDSAGNSLGENIAAAGRLPGSSPTDPAAMVDQWGKTPGMNSDGTSKPSEQQNFKPGTFSNSTTTCPVSKTGDWHDVGHYTQVIWGDTVSIACGFATDSTPDTNGFIWDYLVCRYSPAGNVSGVQVPKPLP
jgi:hypothetical protein